MNLIAPPVFTDEFVVFGILMLVLAGIFYTSSLENSFWKKFYTIFPALFLCYMIPSILVSFNLIATDWHLTDSDGSFVLNDEGNHVQYNLKLYQVAVQLLLPAALILLILSIDLKSLFSLGKKAMIMFLVGTIGVIIGGPVAIMLVSIVSPVTVGGQGFDAVWRGLSTIAGSWIGGGANQAAMLEIYQFNPQKYGGFVLVDILVANIWMALLLFGINKKEAIDKWLRADESAINKVRDKISSYTSSITRMPTLKDYVVLLGITFGAVSLAHTLSLLMPKILIYLWPSLGDTSSMLSTFSDKFFWMVSTATIIGIILSMTKIKEYEGIGASKIGSLFIYILVATIGMKIDLRSVLDYPGLIAVGAIWMFIHVALLFIAAYIIRAPYFFLAVGSMANIGGAASAPVVASAFHTSLTSVGVLLAIFGYMIGTFGAILSAVLMQGVAPL